MFIITGINIKENEKQYVAIDHSSGGYPYWTTFFNSVKMFKTPEDANKFIFQHEFFTEINKMASGEIYPPKMLNQMDMDSIKIEKIVFQEVKQIDFKSVKHEYLEKKKKTDKLMEQLKTL